MAQGIIEETPEIWGEDSSTDSATVERDYDTFAETGSYDETFDEWGYVGPETAAAILKNFVPRQSRILSLIHISEPTRHICLSRMPSSA